MADPTAKSTLYAKGGISLPICEEADPADAVTKNLSNIVLEQNVKGASYSANYIEQDFYLPSDFARGVTEAGSIGRSTTGTSITSVPQLTGAQIYLNADKGATVKYRIYRYDDTLRQREITENNITAATGNGTTVTYTTEHTHYLDPGDFITITGFSVNGFNGSFTVKTVPSSKQFTVANIETGTSISKYGRLTQPPREAVMFGNTWYVKKYTLGYKNRHKIYQQKVKIVNDKKSIMAWNLKTIFNKKINVPKNSLLFFVLPDDPWSSRKHKYSQGMGPIRSATVKKIKGKKGKKKDSYQTTILQKVNVVADDRDEFNRWKKNLNKYGSKWWDCTSFYTSTDFFEIWVPWKPKNKTIKVVESKTTAKQELIQQNMVDYAELLDADSRYDSEHGWEGVVEGEVTVPNNGDQWLDIKFESLELPTQAINQKFKLVVEGATNSPNINHFYYATPSALVNKAQAYKADGTPVSANTSAAMIRILAATANEGVDFLSNEFRSSVNKRGINNVNSRDDQFWSSKPNPSKYGIESLYFDVSNADGEATRIDSVYLDAITPGVQFNVYYSVDDVPPGTDVDSWDQRLWKWVPRVYKANSRKNYLFPNPVSAKYMKVEFTNLQASYYDPGQHDRPILYRKYNSWVVNYFLSIYDMYHNTTEDPFIGSQINLEYDLLDLAYNYYKGDIVTAFARPVYIDEENASNIVPDLLKNAGVNLQNYDSTSLTNINQSFDKFRKHPGYQSNNSDIVGRAATLKSINEFFNYATEKLNVRGADTSTVSTTNRNHLLLEKSMPDMYFYTTCRHGYKEAYAKFENNKAYFVKIKEIKFGRTIHNVISDETIYKFEPSDVDNFETSDFVKTISTTVNKWSVT